MKRTIAVIALLFVLTACGGAASTASDASSASKASAASASRARASAAAALRAKELKDWRTCSATFGPFYTKLHELNSRLSVGLVQADYNTALGEARVPYDDASPKFNTLSHTCLQVGHQLEVAFNQYLKANKYWANCIQNSYCTVDDSQLRSHWTAASSAITRYVNQLASMKP